jgi:hypothetical protein
MFGRIICLVLLIAFPLVAKAAVSQLPKTGEVSCYDTSGNVISCAGTGQDGDKQAGAAWPAPRFGDNGDGTVTDNLTGLIWLKNSACFAPQIWTAALSAANSLQSGQCGLSDNSTAGAWRLPNVFELESLLDISQMFPALPSANPFSVNAAYYWTSSTHAHYATNAWVVNVGGGNVESGVKKTSLFFLWPVKGGQ